MNIYVPTLERRSFLRGLAAGAVALTAGGAFAEELLKTPAQTEGPFYPDKLPLDTDNDLIILNDSLNAGVGEITHLTGRILTASGEPIRNATVEIWQCDNTGVYIHSKDPNRPKFDGNFQGFGRFLTGSTGEYYFRTIKPVPYAVSASASRCPHIHYMIKQGDRELLTTQLYIKGYAMNENDMVYRAIKDAKAREAVQTDFVAIPGSKVGELAAKWDVVIGLTPEDTD